MHLNDNKKTTPSRIVEFYVNDQKFYANEGSSVALALYQNNFKTLKSSPKLKLDRGFFCMMGSCQECLVTIDGKKKLSCQTKIKEQIRINI